MKTITLNDWIESTPAYRMTLIKENGKGLNHKAMRESYDFVHAVVDHIRYAKRSHPDMARYSVKAAVEFLRWNTRHTDSGKTFKINNNLTSDINIFLIRTFPELTNFLSSRKEPATIH